jgi:uncharacterized protein (DUF433 family)
LEITGIIPHEPALRVGLPPKSCRLVLQGIEATAKHLNGRETMLPKPKIKARDAVNDIRAGMTDAELMEKYDLSGKGLQSLFLKLFDIKAITQAELDQRSAGRQNTVSVQPIDGNDMTKDIRSGMTDSELMEKYGLSSEGLRFALQTLTDTKVISVEEVYGTNPVQCDTVSVGNDRELPRCYLALEVHIYESEHPEIRGTLRDVTVSGVGITGIEARIGETKTFVISAENFAGIDAIMFEAECLWARKEADTGVWYAGFEITTISERCLDDLGRLVGAASFYD